MKVSRQLAVAIAVLILPLLPAFADDVTTNVMSPVVSFQYYDSLGEDTNSTIISPTVSYQFFDSLEHAGTNSLVFSPVASYQYFDWAGINSLNLQTSAKVSYYYYNLSGSIVLHGRVTDANGVALSGATVSVKTYLTTVAQTNTDANGYYQMPPLVAETYDIWAWDFSHQTQILGWTLNANTSEQNFHLKPMPPTPTMQQVNRQPTLSYTTGPQGAMLKIFDGTQFVPVTASNTLSNNLITIVLTHGWIPTYLSGNTLFAVNGIDDWPTTLAAQLRANGITSGIANIVAWDWRTASKGIFPLGAPQINTPGQGVALGTNLLTALGAHYSQPIHFIGHSLGTMVNAAAINFLHGEQTPSTRSEISPTPWPKSGEPFIHVTLFDEAFESTSGTTASQLFFDGNTVSQSATPALLSADNNTTLNWSLPLPLHYTWADNYVSLVGLYEPGAVNVLLQNGSIYVNPFNLHSYSQHWYGHSIINPTDVNNPLGFQNSFEYAKKSSLPFSIMPPAELSDAYLQTSLLDELELSPIPFGLGVGVISAYGTVVGGGADISSSLFGSVASAVVTGKDGAIQFAGDVNTAIQDGTQQAGQIISQGVNYANGVAAQGGQVVVNIVDSSASLGLFLTSRLGLSGSFVKNNLHSLETPDGNDASSTSAMAWVPVQFPANVTGMAFDFTVSGDPIDDLLVCGVGTNNLFSLEAKYIPTNTLSASTLIDVSQWAGTTNELFFGFMGGTSTNATLQIQNIRFYSLQPPRLNIQIANGIATLAWPLSANNYVLEEIDSLTATNSWSSVTNVPVIANFQYEVTNELSGICRFYRLKRQ